VRGASSIELAVVGAHLRGQPLNRQLTDRGAIFVRSTRTRACYRLFALPTEPPKPGLVRAADDDDRAGTVEVEIWALDVAEFGGFVSEVPAPLTIGRVQLEGGADVAGFLCEEVATAHAPEITTFGGWLAYRAQGAR
jgi:allophanate hydrolase